MHLDAAARDGHWSSVGGLGTGRISCESGIGFLAISMGEDARLRGKMASEWIFEAEERLNRRRLRRKRRFVVQDGSSGEDEWLVLVGRLRISNKRGQ